MIDVDQGELESAVSLISSVPDNGGTVFLAGNGGSAAIASHASIDLCKAADIPAITLSDPSTITCLANDYGYDQWLSRGLAMHIKPQDLVILISSSGESLNIVNAARSVKELGLPLITFSGFNPTNPLRALGSLNFWVNSSIYNYVELIHLCWLLTIVDKVIDDKSGKPNER